MPSAPENTLLRVPGTFNLRDHGGYRTPSGSIRPRMLMRSNGLTDLKDAGRRSLAQLGVRTAIDLREAGEREHSPADLAGTGIAVRELPIIDGARLTQDEYALASFNRWVLAERAHRVALVFEALCDEEALPAVYFCSTGKDRTGLVSALALSALGVGDDDVVADYALTKSLIPENFLAHAIERGRIMGVDAETTTRHFGSPPQTMRDTLAHLRSAYGGAREYLLGVGVPADALDAMRARLVVPG